MLKQNTATTIVVKLFQSSDHISPATGKTPTVTASKAGAAFASIDGSVSEISSGWYAVSLTADDTDELGDLVIRAVATGCDDAERLFRVVAVDVNDAAGLGLSRLDASVSSRSTYTGDDTTGVTTLLSRLSSDRATKLDNLDATISSRSTYDGSDTEGTTTLLSRLIEERAGNLDNLDAEVSSLSTYDGSDTAGTTTLLSRLTEERAANLDNLDEPVSSRLAANDYSEAPSASTIASAVWSAGTRSLTTFGSLISDIWSNTSRTLSAFAFNVTASTVTDKTGYSLTTAPPTAEEIRAELDDNSTKLAMLDASVSSRLAAEDYSETDMSEIASAIEAVKERTDNLPDDPAATSEIPDASSIASAVWEYVTETGWTAAQSIRVMLASVAAKLSGAGTATVKIRDVNDSKDRITATVDSTGNRSSITYSKD